MTQYRKILVGLDLSEESHQVMAAAIGLRDAYQAQLVMVHIIEPLTFAYGGDIPIDLSEIQGQLQTQAKQQLAQLGSRYGIAQEQQVIICLLYTSPSPRDGLLSRMPSSA